jgi:hypothetical protein
MALVIFGEKRRTRCKQDEIENLLRDSKHHFNNHTGAGYTKKYVER